MKSVRILIVEDETIISLGLKMKLESVGYEVSDYVISGEQAIERLKTEKPNILLLDIMLKGKLNGIETAENIRKFSDVAIIFMTGNDHLRESKQLLKTNPIGVLSKPASDWELFELIEKAISPLKK